MSSHSQQSAISFQIYGIQGFCKALCKKADTAHGKSKNSGKGTGAGYPDKNQAIDEKRNGPDGNDQQIKEKGNRSRYKTSGIHKGQGNRENRTDYSACKSDAKGFQDKGKKPVFFNGKEKAPVWRQKTGKHIFQGLQACSAKIRRRQGDGANNKQGCQKKQQQLYILFFQCVFFSDQGGQIAAKVFNNENSQEKYQ